MQVNYPPNNVAPFFPQQQGLVGAQGTPLATLPAPGTDANGNFVDLNPLQQHQELAADALRAGIDTSPAQGGWATGLARLAQAYMGGKMLNKANTDIAAAKKTNAQAMLEALGSGDWSKLATVDNPQANKLGDALLQAQLKHMQTERLLTPAEIKAADLPEHTVATKSMNGEIKILNRPTTGLPRGYMLVTGPDGQQIQTFIPHGPADPDVIARNAGARTAAEVAARPKKAVAPDQNGVAPWLRKW